MARLHEYQGKTILAQAGIPVPRGGVARTAQEAREQAEALGGAVVVKAQAWVTSRAAQKLIRFADTPDDAYEAAQTLLGQRVGSFPIDTLLVEERVNIECEFYFGLLVDDRQRCPLVIVSGVGGSGIEEIAQQHPEQIAQHAVDVRSGLRDYQARDLLRRIGLSGKLLMTASNLLVKFYAVARNCEARSLEINPLALTTEGDLVALDCRLAVDDYAVFRHPDLGIDIAREIDRPATPLEHSAWEVEKDDYRGTFYFLQLETQFAPQDRVVGFHGVGGGGSMMAMDALLAQGFRIANFVDTSGNPPASKVYRAARIILAQPRVDAYFMGGSGVASQEQFHSARGLVKAFMEVQLNVPAVICIGGNGEEQAIDILHRANGAFPAPLEAFGREDMLEFGVDRLARLVADYTPEIAVMPHEAPPAVEPYRFETVTHGTITFDHAVCRRCESKACIDSCAPQILSLENDVPVLNISFQEAKRGGCVECLACEVECHFRGSGGGVIQLPIPGLDE